MGNAFQPAFSVALVAVTSHTRFIYKLTGAAAFAASYYISHFSPFLSGLLDYASSARASLIWSGSRYHLRLKHRTYGFSVSRPYTMQRVKLSTSQTLPFSISNHCFISASMSIPFPAGCYAIATSLSAPILRSRTTPS